MCVICHKPKDVKFPSTKNIEEMWSANPDGAGIMWRDPKTNEICFTKGFMKVKKFKKWISENISWLESVECALHFRITTHGGTSEGNCHPFVIGKNADPHLLTGRARRVLMHNGMLDMIPRANDISDSAELALRLGKFGDAAATMNQFRECFVGNRILIMDENGTHFFGDKFKVSEDNDNAGLSYSNLNWENRGIGKWFTSCGIGDEKSVSPRYPLFYNERTGEFCDSFTKMPVDAMHIDPNDLSNQDYEMWDAMMGNSDDAWMCEMYGMSPMELKNYRDYAAHIGCTVEDLLEGNFSDEDVPEPSKISA